jgi:hypothetical protein
MLADPIWRRTRLRGQSCSDSWRRWSGGSPRHMATPRSSSTAFSRAPRRVQRYDRARGWVIGGRWSGTRGEVFGRRPTGLQASARISRVQTPVVVEGPGRVWESPSPSTVRQSLGGGPPGLPCQRQSISPVRDGGPAAPSRGSSRSPRGRPTKPTGSPDALGALGEMRDLPAVVA